MKEKKFKIPDAFVIVFALIVIAGVATWFVPGGHYDRETIDVDGSKREVLVISGDRLDFRLFLGLAWRHKMRIAVKKVLIL